MPAAPRRTRRRTYAFLGATAALATAAALAAALPAQAHGGRGHHPLPSRYQDVQLLSFNDLHGNLEPPSGSSGRVTELGLGVALDRQNRQGCIVGQPRSLKPLLHIPGVEPADPV